VGFLAVAYDLLFWMMGSTAKRLRMVDMSRWILVKCHVSRCRESQLLPALSCFDSLIVERPALSNLMLCLAQLRGPEYS
jgi:hypothetical protein